MKAQDLRTTECCTLFPGITRDITLWFYFPNFEDEKQKENKADIGIIKLKTILT